MKTDEAECSSGSDCSHDIRVAMAVGKNGSWELYGSNCENDEEMIDSVREQCGGWDEFGEPQITIVRVVMKSNVRLSRTIRLLP